MADVSLQETFELLRYMVMRYSISSEDRPLRRPANETGQSYTGNIGDDFVVAGLPVQFSFLYRTVRSRNGHLLYFHLEQPTKSISVDLDSSGAGISNFSVLNLIASGEKTCVECAPASVTGKAASINFDGWAFAEPISRSCGRVTRRQKANR
jgi:hypothetical protein